MNREENAYFAQFPSQPRKGDHRKLEILRAAIACVAQSGYDGATLKAVAEHLGTRRSHIVYYFKDRDELLVGALQLVAVVAQSITVSCVSEAKTPLEKIVAISDGAFLWAKEYPDQAKFMLLFYYLCTYEETFRKIHFRIRETGFQRVRELLQSILPEGTPELGLDGLAKSLQVLMMGFLIEQLTTGASDSGKAGELCRKACREWITNFAE